MRGRIEKVIGIKEGGRERLTRSEAKEEEQ